MENNPYVENNNNRLNRCRFCNQDLKKKDRGYLNEELIKKWEDLSGLEFINNENPYLCSKCRLSKYFMNIHQKYKHI